MLERTAQHPLKVAITADPELPVPPKYYGGIERIIDMLVVGLEERGHEVTLFAHEDSRTKGNLVPWPGKASRSVWDTAKNARTLASKIIAGKYDILHSFSRIASLLPVLPLGLPKVMTYQRAVSPRTTRMGVSLSRGTLSFTAISDWMMQDVAHIGRWDMVPNGVPLPKFDYVDAVREDAPLVFLGRVEKIKGPHLAIDIAKATNKRLIIAGNIPEEKRTWVEKNVLTRVDGDQIQFIGPVDDVQKNDLLGRAAAFLMPILWDEPFGIVMAEALACGTPVIGTRRGAVPEVVSNGETGIVRDTVEELIAAMDSISAISRKACRDRAEEKYSQDAVVEGYLSVYRDRISGRNKI